MKACVDCKHSSNTHPPFCYHPDNAYDHVNGGPKVIDCHVARSGWSLYSACGPRGHRFEPREPDPAAPPTWRRFVGRFLAIVKALRIPKP